MCEKKESCPRFQSIMVQLHQMFEGVEDKHGLFVCQKMEYGANGPQALRLLEQQYGKGIRC